MLEAPCLAAGVIEAASVSEKLVRIAEETPNCAGLSAPQIGSLLRVFVLNFRATEPAVFINPQGMYQSAEWESGQESCLSLPGIVGLVRRPLSVGIRYEEIKGGVLQPASKVFTGFEARVVAHEMDHLEGKTILNYMTKIQKAQAISIMQTARLKASRRPLLKNPAGRYFESD